MDILLGGGSYGVVVRVSKAGLYFAMKVYSDTYFKQIGQSSFLAVDLFQHEREIIRSIRHPNIPAYIDSFSSDNMHCLIQDYIAGDTLAANICQGYCYRETEVIELVFELLKTLSFLHVPAIHSTGVIHRDLRLSNLIQAKDRLVIIDFGLAYRLYNVTDRSLLAKSCRAKEAAGDSSSYMRMRNDFSVNSDLFGAGVVAVDLFTNSVAKNETVSWEQCIQISPAFKSFIRRLLGAEGSFASCDEALECLNVVNFDERRAK